MAGLLPLFCKCCSKFLIYYTVKMIRITTKILVIRVIFSRDVRRQVFDRKCSRLFDFFYGSNGGVRCTMSPVVVRSFITTWSGGGAGELSPQEIIIYILFYISW